jgi:hypothetical protein
MRLVLLLLFFLTLFFQGTLSEHVFGVTYDTTGEAECKTVRYIVEVVFTINLIFFALCHNIRFTYPFIMALCYMAWSILSGILTSGDSAIMGFKYARYTFYAFLFYTMIQNQRFSQKELKIINVLLGILFFLELCISIIRVIFYERVEWRVGTMTTTGGELATVFPLFAMCFTIAFYFYVKNSVWVMLAGLSFGLIGYASGKRAIFFLMPLFLVICFGLFSIFERKAMTRRFIRRFVLHALFCLLLFLPLWLTGIETTEGTSSDGEEKSLYGKVRHAIEYAAEYETGEAEWGNKGTSGRVSTSIHVLQTLCAWRLERILIGWGPGSFTTKSDEQTAMGRGFASLDIAYGIVGWSQDTICIGVPGMLLLCGAYGLAFRRCIIVRNMSLLSPYWKAIHFGTVLGFIVFFYEYLFYGSLILMSNPITFVLLFYAALLCSPHSGIIRRVPVR